MSDSHRSQLEILPLVPDNAARSAIHAIGGYAYQLMCTAAAWADLPADGLLYVEVAEDYATAVNERLEAVQVKRTSGTITLRSKGVIAAINNFWCLRLKNPDRDAWLRFLTTSRIGRETDLEFADGTSGLEMWRRAARHGADVAAARTALRQLALSEELLEFLAQASDQDVREQLLRRIHWDVEQPAIDDMRRNAEQKLVHRGRAITPGATVAELSATLDAVLVRILEIASKGSDRVLTAVDLDAIIEQRTQTAIPNAALRQLLAGQLGEAEVAPSESIVDAADRPLPVPVAERSTLLDGFEFKLGRSGWLVLQGGSGLGKSTAARLLARRIGGRWPLVDFRGADADKTRLRLTQCIAHLRSGTAGVILDDLPVELDAEVEDLLGVVRTAALAGDCLVIVTCSRAPSNRVFAFASEDVVARMPNLETGDVEQLVEVLGGPAGTWGAITRVVCGNGNPQLVHARLKRLAQLGWPQGELIGGLDPAVPAVGVDDERTTARRRLRREMDEPARNFLYRLSIIAGQFDRQLALALGKVATAIGQPGEQLDWLIGPWVEDLGRGYYRLSPLLAGAARKVVAQDEIKAVQHAIAGHLVARRPLSGALLSTAFVHALGSGHEGALTLLASLPMTTHDETKRHVTQELMALKYLRLDAPLWPANPYIGVLLRLAQFHVLVEFEEWAQAHACLSRLLQEAPQLAVPQLGSGFELIALCTGLGETRTPERHPDWLRSILRLRQLLRTGEGRVLLEAQSRAEHLRG